MRSQELFIVSRKIPNEEDIFYNQNKYLDI